MCSYLDLTKGAEEMSARLEAWLPGLPRRPFQGCKSSEPQRQPRSPWRCPREWPGWTDLQLWALGFGRVEGEGEGAQAFGRHLKAPLSSSAWYFAAGCAGCTSVLPQGLCLGWEGYLSWLALNYMYIAWHWCSGWEAVSPVSSGAGPEISLSG